MNINSKLRSNLRLLSLIVFFGFFLIGLAALSDYGPNWDEPEHFMRGQAYLRYFLAREKDYNHLPVFQEFQRHLQNRKEKIDIILPRYSLYQSNILNGEYFLQNDSGHPPLNGILAALTNYIFYQKLGVLGDIEAYHLFIVFISSCLALLVFYWAQEEYGLFAGLASFLSISLYPLFLGESHNNIKDPIEAFFYALTIYAFYQGVRRKSWRWFLASALACGFALGTKFNIFFVPFIIFPWLIVRFSGQLLKFKHKIVFKIAKIPKNILLSLLFYPLIVLLIFFFSWPYLWQDPIINFLNIFGYYKQMGLEIVSQPPSFYFSGFNTYPTQTILFTTPLVILIFSFWGIIAAFFLFRTEKNKTSFLFLLWFLVPIIRVSLPGTSIYGGVRQIMEYIPAMALLSGLGIEHLVASVIAHFSARQTERRRELKYAITILIVLMFLPITLKMIQIHPNENAYFNPLIGGLKGAKERDYPYWGVTLGSVNKQGIDWLNQNAEKEAKVALVVSTAYNLPRIYLREDIEFDNLFWSGARREGEYLIEAVYQDWIREWYHCGEHVDRLLKPVHEIKVDGVPILKIWKNDWEYVYPQYRQEEQLTYQVNWQVKDSQIFLELPEERELMKISWTFDEQDCPTLESGQVFRSLDGLNWLAEREWIRDRTVAGVDMVKKGRIDYPLAAKEAKYVKIQLKPKNTCPLKIRKLVVDVITPTEL